MLKISNVKIPYKANEKQWGKYIFKKIGVKDAGIFDVKLIRKSLDSRESPDIKYVCSFSFCAKNEDSILKKCKDVSVFKNKKYSFEFEDKLTHLSDKVSPVIVGTGPSGLFCALMLSKAGLCPTVIERGEKVDQRKKSIENFWNGISLDENSNVQFGEGGAGTFSDGKLTCGVNDIRMDYIKEEFVRFGSPEDILTNAKPHIGTDYLYVTVKNIRDELQKRGCKVLFDTKMCDMDIENGQIKGIYTENSKTGEKSYISCSHLICATGHSSRETYEMMKEKGFLMERKPFSVGVRIEHRKEDINKIQYKSAFEDNFLPTADYKLSSHPDCRGVYTFCMCPGGYVVASASEKEGVVTNGMSYYRRDAENSNSAVLVSVLPDDIEGDDVLGGMYFQRDLEKKAFILGGKNYHAPCQRLGDFLESKSSMKSGKVLPSYMPGVKYVDLNSILPTFVSDAMKKAFYDFDKKMKGFLQSDALLTGVETRSSAPVRIIRDENGESNIKGVYPVGEGAGYAGGIMSSACDGIKCAENICRILVDL